MCTHKRTHPHLHVSWIPVTLTSASTSEDRTAAFYLARAVVLQSYRRGKPTQDVEFIFINFRRRYHDFGLGEFLKVLLEGDSGGHMTRCSHRKQSRLPNVPNNKLASIQRNQLKLALKPFRELYQHFIFLFKINSLKLFSSKCT